MARIIDITDKLSFEENPTIVIKGKNIEVNDDAVTVLKLLNKIGDAQSDPSILSDLAEMLFTEESKKELDSLKLTVKDYGIVIENAMNMIIGDDEPGE